MYCTCCGLCCRNLDKIELPEEYKDLDSGNGICKYLEGNFCSIFRNRPLICNSDKMYELYYKSKYVTKGDFENYLNTLCKLIQEGKIYERFCKDS